MGHTIQYKDLGDPQVRRKAICDLIFYLGNRRTRVLIRWARLNHDQPDAYDRFTMFAALGGVQGFPVKALWDYVTEEKENK